jgi:hypothetical protein
MSKTITLRISEDHYEAFKKYAQMDNRKISNAIETLALKQLEIIQSRRDNDLEEVLTNEELRARLLTGIKQAKEKRGRFVKN